VHLQQESRAAAAIFRRQNWIYGPIKGTAAMLETTDEILQILREIMRANETVRLINIYKGYPVSYDARILSIGIDAGTFKVHPYQALCLWMENQTFIQSKHLPEIVRALAVTVDLEQEIAALSNFQYVSGAAGKRQDERVQLRKSIEVFLTIGSRRFRTELRDLSTGGMAVFLDAAYYDPAIFQPDAPLELTFQLPGKESNESRDVQLYGLIRSITRERVNRYRLGIQILPSEQSLPVVSSYVIQRQSEVLDEIEMLHSSILGLSTAEGEPGTNNAMEAADSQ
jgi:hypothetical protein